MTQLLEKALDQVAVLPEVDQDAIATLILEELEDESRWNKSFARSAELLERLAGEALAEHRAGRTRALDPDTL